jgi:hypothetical protein
VDGEHVGDNAERVELQGATQACGHDLRTPIATRSHPGAVHQERNPCGGESDCGSSRLRRGEERLLAAPFHDLAGLAVEAGERGSGCECGCLKLARTCLKRLPFRGALGFGKTLRQCPRAPNNDDQESKAARPCDHGCSRTSHGRNQRDHDQQRYERGPPRQRQEAGRRVETQ